MPQVRDVSVTKLVLIGGSAGALAALRGLFENLPPPCGLTYLIVPHFSSPFKSQLPHILSKWTALPVCQVTENQDLLPDGVYVNPPGQDWHFDEQGQLRRRPDGEAADHKPIDRMCRSLAEAYGADAALVVLSGTGSDGTLGARAVKQAGGIVLVQDPATADYAAMPRGPLEAGLADRVLPPETLGTVLCFWGRHGRLSEEDPQGPPEAADQAILAAILELVRRQTGRDLHGYKPATLWRRIQRRMGLRHIRSPAIYRQFLRQTAVEVERLAQDLCLGVTTFFRDPEAFQTLSEQAVTALCANRAAEPPLRIWVAGCSTGEEAYSVAMLLQEATAPASRWQIFATDIDEAALEIARAGVYSAPAVSGLSATRLARFFHQERQGYRVIQALRETIVFAAHNLLRDPPFARLDLLVCRNLLIYLEESTQARLLEGFRDALNPGGYLFLGHSENLRAVAPQFRVLSKRWRLYQRTAALPPRLRPSWPIPGSQATRRLLAGEDSDAETRTLAAQNAFYRQLIETHGPAQILIDAQGRPLFLVGDVAPYLAEAADQNAGDLFQRLRPDLLPALRQAINGTQRRHDTQTVHAVLLAAGDGEKPRGVRIEARPIASANRPDLLLLSLAREAAAENRPAAEPAEEDWILRQLLGELEALRQDRQRTLEQARISSEEMTAANEEMLAMNEELQSANEELESSREELQSLNEELFAANSGLDAKVSEIESLNADLANLLHSTETPTLLLDSALGIRRFTPACTRLMRLIPSDLGRALEDVVWRFEDPDLGDDCRRAVEGAAIAEREVRDRQGRWYLRRLRPYRDAGQAIAGVVLTFVDIDALKQADELLRQHTATLQWQADLLSQAAPIIGRDPEGRILFWNKGAQELYGWSAEEALGRMANELLHTRFPQPLEQILEILKQQGHWQGELVHTRRDAAPVAVDSRWTPFRDDQDNIQAYVEVETDIRARKAALEALRASEAMFHTMVDCTYNWEYWIDPAGEMVYMTPSAQRLTGYAPAEFTADPGLIDRLVSPLDELAWNQHRHQISTSREEVSELELRLRRKNGEELWVHHSCRAVTDASGRHLGRRVSVRDISAQKRAEGQIHSLAYFDPLTRLPNRRLLMDRLAQALTASKRSGLFGALFMLDLDHFKELNDTQGHDIGDRLLAEVGQRLTACMREVDTVSRLGGDEFVILAEKLGREMEQALDQAETIAEKLRDALSRPYVLSHTMEDYRSTSSIGVTLFQGLESSAEVLLKQADLALYQAKDAGRNAVRHFNAGMQAAIDRRMRLVSAMRRALEAQEFRLYYQPQVDREGRLIGAEALIRWHDPHQGVILPAQFIQLAEESGCILDLGHWVLETACRQLKRWEKHPHRKTLQLAINLSARQFHQPGFVEWIWRGLASSGANPHLLRLELTEGVVLGNLAEVTSRMYRLAKLGVRFALDDFGTGYSSLHALKSLPIDQIKIDRSFIQSVPGDPNDSAIVRAILAMCRSLGLQVIAEGVETPPQQDFLIQEGCTAFQGHLFGKPLPIEEWGDS